MTVAADNIGTGVDMGIRPSAGHVNQFLIGPEHFDDDMLRDDFPPDAVDSALREMGVDPAALAKRGAAFLARLEARHIRQAHPRRIHHS